MKAQHALGLNLSWLRVTVVFLVDIAILVAAGRWPGDAKVAMYLWWTGVGVAALVAIIALVTYRRVPLSRMWLAWLREQFADPSKALAEGRTKAVDKHRRYGRETVGIREYGGRLVSLISVSGRPASPAGRHSRVAEPAATLSVVSLAGGLRQFDVRLESIDVISVGTSRVVDADSADDADADGESGTAAGDLEPRRSWIVLRMDPQHNVGAVATRDSLAATLAAATERLAQEVDGRFVNARVVTAEEFDAVDEAVLAGLEPNHLRSRLFRKRTARVTSFWVSPRDINTENLDELWLPETDATVVTVRLLPRHGRTAEVSVLARYHSTGKLDKNVRSALNRFVGRRQLDAVCASLPVPVPGAPMIVPGRVLADDERLLIALDPMDEYTPVRVGAQS